jgi:hypothetical protein
VGGEGGVIYPIFWFTLARLWLVSLSRLLEYPEDVRRNLLEMLTREDDEPNWLGWLILVMAALTIRSWFVH